MLKSALLRVVRLRVIYLFFSKLPVNFKIYFYNEHIKQIYYTNLFQSKSGETSGRQLEFSEFCITGNFKLMDNAPRLVWPQRISKWMVTSTCESRLSFHCSCGMRHAQVGSIPPHREREFNRQPIPLEDLVLEELGKFGCSEKEQWPQIGACRVDSFWSLSPVKL